MKHEYWWERPDLRYEDNILHLGEQNLYDLAYSAQTPTFVYSARRIQEKIMFLHTAFKSHYLENYQVLYAMKANRNVALLTALRTYGSCGIDVCSPPEVLQCRQVGFAEPDISYTGTSVSDADLDIIARHPEVWFNSDSLSVIRRLGERCPGRKIGLRINVGIGVGYNQMMHYAGEKVTKFGIYHDRFEEALKLAQKYDLKVEGLHFHCGSGYLTPQLPIWERILDTLFWFLDRAPEMKIINLGGGLGSPLTPNDKPLDVIAWGEIVARKLGHLNVKFIVEPGDYLARDCGIMLLQVNTVERKRDIHFIGVDGGFNLHNEPAYYKLPLTITPVRLRPNPKKKIKKYTIAGNINEALDIFAHDVELPPVKEGDYLAFLNAGSYGAALSSNHCMRGHYREYVLV